MKPVIALDIDDTLLEHFSALADWYNGIYGTSLTLAHNHPRGEEALAAWKADTIDEAIRRVHNFYDTEAFSGAVPFSEASDIITRLSDRYDVVIVTARDTLLEAATHSWLEQHFRGLYREVHFTSHYSLVGKSRTKNEVIEAIEASYLIDDSLENCLEATRIGAKSILFGDYPWNKADSLPASVTRCRNWQEVADYFDVE